MAILIFLLLLCIPRPVHGAIHLNEIYTNPLAGEYEFVELINDGDTDVNTEEYTVTDEKGTVIHVRDPIIAAHGYVVATSSSVLNNSGETVILRNQSSALESISVPALPTSKSYSHCPDAREFIVTSLVSRGTQNDEACIILTPSPTPLTPTEYIPLGALHVSEFMPNPLESGNEWVELYNSADSPVTVTKWQLDDAADQGASPYSFSAVIQSHGYAVISFPSDRLNNSQDTLRLIAPDGTVIETYSYPRTERGMSWGIANQALCIQNPSPLGPNLPCTPTPVTPTPTVRFLSPTPVKISPSHIPSISPRKIISINQNKPHTATHSASILGVVTSPTPTPSPNKNGIPSTAFVGAAGFLIGASAIMRILKKIHH